MNAPAFPVTIAFDIFWADMDAFGHVNNARYFTWFESCRTAYFARIGLRVDRPTALGPIVAHIECDYLAPIVYPAKLVCAARVPKIGNTSFVMDYLLWQADAPDRPSARGTSVIVAMDYTTKEKVRVPDDIRRAIDALEGRG